MQQREKNKTSVEYACHEIWSVLYIKRKILGILKRDAATVNPGSCNEVFRLFPVKLMIAIALLANNEVSL